jgi:hypothetical protein
MMRQLLLVGALIVVGGCAAPASDTQRFKEHVGVHIITPPDLEARSIEDSLLQWIAKGLAYIIEKEADKYTSLTSASSFRVDLKTRPSNPQLPWLFIIVRTVEAADDKLKTVDGLIKEDSFLKGVPQNWDGKKFKEVFRIAAGGKGESRVTFCALGEIERFVLPTPTETTTELMRLKLTRYIYPGLKAKALPFPVPFTDWDRPASHLTITLSLPDGDYVKEGKGNKTATGSFQPRWQRGSVKWIAAPAEKATESRRWTTDPIVTPHWDTGVAITGMLLESNDIQKALLELAKQIEKAKLAGLFGSDDDKDGKDDKDI